MNRRTRLAVDDFDPITDDGPLGLCQCAEQLAREIAERRAASREMKRALAFGDDARGNPFAIRTLLVLRGKEIVEAEGLKCRQKLTGAWC